MKLAGWKQVAQRTWTQLTEDNIGLVAAGVAFYGFLALVPLLGATVLIYGLVADPQTVADNVKSLTSVIPKDAAKLIGEQLMSVVQSSGSKKGFGLLFAVAIALFGARNAAGSVIVALNIAYEEEEKRGFLKVNLLSLAVTAGAVLMAVIALLAITALGYLEKLFPHAPSVLLGVGKLLSYVSLLFGAAAAAATLYRYGPDRRCAKWAWITPGTIFAAVAWLLLTFGFGVYVANFGNYNKTYGSLATVVILVTWMYLSAYVLLFGAELNSALDHQTDRAKSTARPKKERGTWSAGHGASHEQANPDDRADLSTNSAVSEPGARIQPANKADALEPQLPAQKDLSARVASRAVQLVGLIDVGIVPSLLSTFGLSLLRKRARAGAGGVLLAAAAGLSLWRRR